MGETVQNRPPRFRYVDSAHVWGMGFVQSNRERRPNAGSTVSPALRNGAWAGYVFALSR